MKISFKQVGVNGWLPLSDVTQGDCTEPWSGSFRDTNQVVPGFGSDSQAVIAESNTLVTLRVPLVQNFSSLQYALASIRVWRLALAKKQLHLQYLQDGETQYYPNGSMSDMEYSVKGSTVEFVFTFQTQDVTATQPTT